jgi:serine/threonine-protein kinase
VHRDVKPSNLFLVRGDAADVRLLDFGLARGKDGLRVTKTGALVGTPGYMAPEQVRGEARIGPRADVFALGAVLFECLAGRPAFFAEDAVQVLAKILLEEPPLAAEVRPAVPLALEGIVEAMLAKDPALRPDAATVAQELSAIEAIVVEPSEGARPAVGAMIGGKYRVEGTIGEGGMGVILEATHVELGRKVAIKILRGRRGDDEARLLREARALSQLTSEHAARVLDVGKLDDGAPYMVIERLEGRDLGRELRERGSLPCAEAARHVVAACEAIAEAHELGIIHRDLKPSNLFLARRRDGSTCLKVLDFGISKVEESAPGERSLTSATAVLGSPWYMSPEQLASAKAVDARSDVWALGVVLHELCTGAPPFDAETAAGVGAKIAAAAATPLRALRKEAPEALEKAILRCLAKDPAARFPSARELARALAGIEAPPRRAPRRGAAAAVVVLAGIGVAAMALRPRAPVETAPSARVAIDAAPPAISASAVASATAPATATATAISSAVARPAAKPRPPPLAGALPVAVLPPIVSAAPPPPPPPAPPPKPTAPPRTVDLGDPALDGR